MNWALKCTNRTNRLLLAERTPQATFLCFERGLIVYAGEHTRYYSCPTSHACLTPTHIAMAHGGRMLGFNMRSSSFDFYLAGFRYIAHIAYYDGRLVIGNEDAVFEFQRQNNLLSLVELASDAASSSKSKPRGCVAVASFLIQREKKQLMLLLNGAETMRFASDAALVKGCLLINQVESIQYVLLFNSVSGKAGGRFASVHFTRGVSNLEEFSYFGKINVIGYLCAYGGMFCITEHFCQLLRDKLGIYVKRTAVFIGTSLVEEDSTQRGAFMDSLQEQLSMCCLIHFEQDCCIFSTDRELIVVWQYGHFSVALDERKVTLEDAVASAVFGIFFAEYCLFYTGIQKLERRPAERSDYELFLELVDCIDYSARLAAKMAPFGTEHEADARVLIGVSETSLATRYLLAIALWMRGKEIGDLERISELVRYQIECCCKRCAYEALRVLYRKIEVILPDMVCDVFQLCSRFSTLVACELSFGCNTDAAWPGDGAPSLEVVEAFSTADVDL